MTESMAIEVAAAPPEQGDALANMLELYQHDLSDIWQQDLDERGRYGYDLSRYWSDARCFPYLVMAEGKLAGFALVDQAVKLPGGDFWMDQFFVLKKYRRRGVGRAVAHELFTRHQGRWQVGQMADNGAALAFWRATIAAYTGGHFDEHSVTEGWWQGTIQAFST